LRLKLPLNFIKLSIGRGLPSASRSTAFLQPNNWDDFGHKTLFNLTVFDEDGYVKEIGAIKIGFIGQNGGWTSERIPQQFESLDDQFYSLGQDADFYTNLTQSFSRELTLNLLNSLRDVAHDHERLIRVEHEDAFNVSLLRSVNRRSIDHQFIRILQYQAPLTEYNFYYEKPSNNRYAGFKLEFSVDPNIKPNSNIHVLIGRNGVGKTTLLNNMVDALLPSRGERNETGYFAASIGWNMFNDLSKDYFAGVVSISFSAFDPFEPPYDQPNANEGMRYYYVGLKKRDLQLPAGQWGMKSKRELCDDFTCSLKLCFALNAKKERWLRGVEKLESDLNFAEMELSNLIEDYNQDISENKTHFLATATGLFGRMSSGHAIVLLTITKLVETVEEKTLVLLDEPESHLHPPLLSAFTRALSDLLANRNGLAIIATHSPVVLQEVPRTCVSILRRSRLVANIDRPENNTFAENVGALTREVFGLEVSKSGFHELLTSSVAEGKSFEEIEGEYHHQLGFEGKVILRSLIAERKPSGGLE